MFAILLLAALTCDPTALKAKSDAAHQYIDAAQQDDDEIAARDEDIRDARATIAREKSNPSGVVNLVLLHNMGDAIQTDLEWRAYYVAKRKADMAQAKKLIAEIDAGALVCKKLRASTPTK